MAFATTLLASIPAGLSTALSLGGTALSVVGAVTSANATARAAEYNARTAERDIVVADQNRQLAVSQAAIDAADKRRENRRVLASMRASYGASGVELAGSPLDVLEDTAVEQELDASRVEFEGRARGREGALQMLGLHEGATLSRMEGRGGRRGGTLNAIGVGMSGAGTTLSRVA